MVSESKIVMGMNHDFRTSWQPRPTKLRSLHAFRPARIPIRTPAVAATDDGRLVPEGAAGIGRREARYSTPTRPHGSDRPPGNRATGARAGGGAWACRRSSRAPTFPGGSRRLGNLTPPTGRHHADHGCAARHASPSPRRRSRRRTTGGGRRNGRRNRARSALCNATRRLRPSGSYPQAHLRHGRAGCASASR
jgi:hypothetical protein